MGVIVLGRKYTPSKYVSVLMITVGTIVCTFASAEHVVSTAWMVTAYGWTEVIMMMVVVTWR